MDSLRKQGLFPFAEPSSALGRFQCLFCEARPRQNERRAGERLLRAGNHSGWESRNYSCRRPNLMYRNFNASTSLSMTSFRAESRNKSCRRPNLMYRIFKDDTNNVGRIKPCGVELLHYSTGRIHRYSKIKENNELQSFG